MQEQTGSGDVATQEEEEKGWVLSRTILSMLEAVGSEARYVEGPIWCIRTGMDGA